MKSTTKLMTMTFATVMVGCGASAPGVDGTGAALAEQECIGNPDTAGDIICAPRPELWTCDSVAQASQKCRRLAFPSPDGSADWSCSHKGASVECAAGGARHHDDDHIWLCGADGAQTNCTSTGSVVPPAGGGLWKCEIEHMQLECTQVTVGDHGDDDLGVPDLRADLPYDARPQVGETYQLSQSFLEKGALPAAVLKVTMEGTPWRLKELRDDTPFVITEQDCSHQGNRDTGRDRAFVTWRNTDGSVETDHIDLRYCKN